MKATLTELEQVSVLYGRGQMRHQFDLDPMSVSQLAWCGVRVDNATVNRYECYGDPTCPWCLRKRQDGRA